MHPFWSVEVVSGVAGIITLATVYLRLYIGHRLEIMQKQLRKEYVPRSVLRAVLRSGKQRFENLEREVFRDPPREEERGDGRGR